MSWIDDLPWAVLGPDGWATKPGKIKVWYYDVNNYAYLEKTSIDSIKIGLGLTPGETYVEPPKYEEGFIPVWSWDKDYRLYKGTWTVVKDYRGKLIYDKNTGIGKKNTDLSVPDGFLLASEVPAPTELFSKWDEEKKDWVYNEELRNEKLPKMCEDFLMQLCGTKLTLNMAIGANPGPVTVNSLKTLKAIAEGEDKTSRFMPAIPSDLTV